MGRAAPVRPGIIHEIDVAEQKADEELVAKRARQEVIDAKQGVKTRLGNGGQVVNADMVEDDALRTAALEIIPEAAIKKVVLVEIQDEQVVVASRKTGDRIVSQ